MRKDLTDITVILDRSGSMQSGLSDTIGGLNSFIEQQKKEPGEAIFTLIQFDDKYEFVHKAVPLKDVPVCNLIPRSSTALLDAVGKGIVETGERLAAMPEEQRPGLVLFVIVTDGQENSSREYKRAQVRELIEKQTNDYKWHFTFLGANAEAFAEGGSIGTQSGGTAQYTNAGIAMRATSEKTSRMRAASFADQNVNNDYTAEERAAMSGNV